MGKLAKPSALYPLTDLCPKCGTGHLANPCQGVARCLCRCRKCDARMHHKPWGRAALSPEARRT